MAKKKDNYCQNDFFRLENLLKSQPKQVMYQVEF